MTAANTASATMLTAAVSEPGHLAPGQRATGLFYHAFALEVGQGITRFVHTSLTVTRMCTCDNVAWPALAPVQSARCASPASTSYSSGSEEFPAKRYWLNIRNYRA